MNQTIDLYSTGNPSVSIRTGLLPERKKASSSGQRCALRPQTAMMLYSIIEVEDQALKDRLAVTCDNQPFIAKRLTCCSFSPITSAGTTHTAPVGQSALRSAQRRNAPSGEGDLLWRAATLIAAQTAVIAAESLGIGSCYIGDIIRQYGLTAKYSACRNTSRR